MKFIRTTSALLFLFLSHAAYAQPIGCQALNSNVVYTENLLGIWSGNTLSTVCTTTATRTTPYAANVRIRPGRTCNINLLGSGNEVYYNVAYCPLDHYLLIFGSGIGLLGFRMLSRRLA